MAVSFEHLNLAGTALGSRMIAEGGGIDPIHQFALHKVIALPKLFGADLSISNSTLFMILSALALIAFFWAAGRQNALVPNRLQSLGELATEGLRGLVRSMIGDAGARFFPFVFTLFTFILAMNFVGLVPGAFTATSQLAVTATLAIVSFLTVVVVAFRTNGLRFFTKFYPKGVIWPLALVVMVIELVSFLMRPLTLALRLFGNMLGGHIVLKVFASFVALLLGAGGAVSALAVAPFLGAVALTALEVLVAGLQAFVFAVLTCVYLNDVLHIDHH